MITPEQLARLRADRAASEHLAQAHRAAAEADAQRRQERARGMGRAMAAQRLSWAQIEALRAFLARLRSPCAGIPIGACVQDLEPALPREVVYAMGLRSDAEVWQFLLGVEDVAALV